MRSCNAVIVSLGRFGAQLVETLDLELRCLPDVVKSLARPPRGTLSIIPTGMDREPGPILLATNVSSHRLIYSARLTTMRIWGMRTVTEAAGGTELCRTVIQASLGCVVRGRGWNLC